MANFEKIREAIKSAFEGDITPEQAEKLGRINSVVDEAEKEDNDFIAKHEELRTKYINAIKENSFAGEPKPTNVDTEPKDLAYYLKQQEKKAKN